MKQLSELLVPSPRGLKKGQWVGQIRDPRSRQTLIIESDAPLHVYDLEKAQWGEGEKHSDAVVIGEVDGEAWVCFIELKGRSEAEDLARGLEQLRGSARHFHPEGQTHGSEHHERWASGDDVLEVAPKPNHRVVGAAVAFRQVPRPPPTHSTTLGTTEVFLRAVQLSTEKPQEARVSFRDLLSRMGLLAPA